MSEPLAVQFSVLDVVAGCSPLELAGVDLVLWQCPVPLVLNNFVHPARLTSILKISARVFVILGLSRHSTLVSVGP